jgi:transposase
LRASAKIVAWMDPDQLASWVHDAPSKEIYRRRLAIWWTTRWRHAHEVAELLLTSARTVRYWIRQFNADSPTALDEENFGGRRGAYLSEAEERAVLARLRPRARAGRLVTIAEMRAAVEASIGHSVSDGYLYSYQPSSHFTPPSGEADEPRHKTHGPKRAGRPSTASQEF